MIPPNEVKFFFSNNQDQFFIARDSDQVTNLHKQKTIPNVRCYDESLRSVKLYELNKMQV